MASIEKFEDLKVWQKARTLCIEIHHLTRTGNFSTDFALRNQIHRSSGSIMDNIAEGFGRKGNFEFINFLTFSSGSNLECKSQLYRAADFNYINAEKMTELTNLSDEIGKMLSSLITYLGDSDIKGFKFKGRK
jgi:four helix bundle protein